MKYLILLISLFMTSCTDLELESSHCRNFCNNQVIAFAYTIDPVIVLCQCKGKRNYTKGEGKETINEGSK